MTGNPNIDLNELCQASLAGDRLQKFMEYCWLKPNTRLIVGKHTREICARIDEAIEKYKKGISSYLHIVVPFRHGKSDMSSRYLPPYFLGMFPDDEVIQASYGAGLSEGFSKDVKKIMDSEKYENVFDTRLDKKTNSSSERHVQDHVGKYYAVGADGGATGKGANLLIVDDFFKNRAEAESETTRKKRWDSFTQDFVSRLAPVHIVLVLNTRWHVDDISGNILKKNNPNDKKYDEEFPVFENLHYKARQDDGTYLFPERFDESWYKKQFAIQGKYGSASLLQGEPTLRGGNMFHMEGLRYINQGQLPQDLLWVRFWDLASTEKEREKDDPDWTVGTKCAYREYKGVPQFFVWDEASCQEEAPKRNAMIKRVTESDGPKIWQGVESVAGYKDTYTTMKHILTGKAIVHKCTVSKDKIVRASVLEPLFDSGMIFFVRGKWNDDTYEQLEQFPASLHDDRVDGCSGGYELAKKRYDESQNIGGTLGKGAQKGWKKNGS
jgi:predicted phage terminase large subunit-like protein